MQRTIITSTQGIRFNLPTGEIPKEQLAVQHKENKKGNTKVRKSENDFLTSTFKPIHIGEVLGLFREDNYKYLYDTANNYILLTGNEFDLEYNPKDWKELCEYFSSTFEYGYDIYLKRTGNKFQFIVEETSLQSFVFYFSCKIIDEKKGVFKKILIDFFRLFQQCMPLETFRSCTDYDWYEQLAEEYNEAKIKENLKEVYKTANDYINGKAARTLKRIECPKYIRKNIPKALNALEKLIKGYKPEDEKEKRMCKLFLRGIRLFRTGKDFFHYVTQDKHSGIWNVHDMPVSIDQMYRVIYDFDDAVCRDIDDGINEMAGNNGAQYVSGGLQVLTPHTKRIFKGSPVFHRFSKYLKDLYYEL